MAGIDSDCPLVLIEWQDSAQPVPKWIYLSDFEPGTAVSCVSVGWLIQDDEKVKVLAPNMGEIQDATHIQASGIIRIPCCAVTRIVHLKEGRKITFGGPSSRPGRVPKKKPS